MPELPEVEALAEHLRTHAVARPVARVDLASMTVLKTFDPPLAALHGRFVAGAERIGKYLDVVFADPGGAPPLHLVVHLSRAGWLRWHEQASVTPPKPGKGPLEMRVHLDAVGGPGFDLTEAGTQRRLAAHVVTDPALVPKVAGLGPDALTLTADGLAALLRARHTATAGGARGDTAGGDTAEGDTAEGDTAEEDRAEEETAEEVDQPARRSGSSSRLKTLLTDQRVLAGIGNAYSDEILHVARLSPFAIAGKLDDDAVGRLYAAMTEVLRGAVDRAVGQDAARLKGEKRSGMRVHARAGLPCPVCGDTVREVSYADRSFQYCATCQTGGRALADRRLSRLVK